jgi:hypothetical protein
MARTLSPTPTPATTPPLDWSTRLGVAVGLAYVAVYVAIALLRMGYPFELEWMEGSSLGHVDRLLHGQPLYVKPGLDFTPFIYPPLYFMVASWVAKLMGTGFLPLRLVSFAASLGCLVLIYTYVRAAGASRWPAVLAACLFAASYRQGGAWLDIGRADSLFLMLLLAGAVALRRSPSPWIGGVVGGALFALAALTKQSALFIAAPVGLAVLITDPKRGVGFAATLAVVFAASVWALDRQSGGWFLFYTFGLPRDHPIIGQLLRGFWIQDLLGPLGIALVLGAAHFFVAPARPRWRALALDAALWVGLIATGYATRVRVGSFVNVVVPAYLGVSLLFGLGLAALDALRRADSATGRRVERFVALLLIAQFAVLAYKPWEQLPTPADRAAGQQIVESLHRVEGEVWVPRHPYLAVMAGKPWRAHELALQDVLRPTETAQARELLAEIRAAARSRRFALLVLDDETWIHHEFQPYYRLEAHMFGTGETNLFWPKTGYVTRPDFVWVPKPDSVGAP